MSGEANTAAAVVQNDVCANCGIAQVDEIKLDDCGGCDLVKYCSDKCKKEEHREQHEEECKKRAKKLHDDDLFTQPDGSHLGECLICFLPMPLEHEKSMYWPCCSNLICMGCIVAQAKAKSEIDDQIKASRCPFCREPAPHSSEETTSQLMERVNANDPAALSYMGGECYAEGDYDSAFDYCTKAAELGDVGGHYKLACLYGEGKGVEKDEEKGAYHFEKAAIGGHPGARMILGYSERMDGRVERAVKHFIIAAKLGSANAMEALWGDFKDGNITKADLNATLRAHHAAIDAMKSSERDFAEKFFLRNVNFLEELNR
jgi:tetratricopeptide (TPR) repeat protein